MYYAAGQRVAMRVSHGPTASPYPAPGATQDEVYYLLSDHLGSTTVTVNSDGTVKSRVRYDAWGKTRYTSGTTPTDRKYTGQIEEATIGLYFYNARWYDPALGRFIQADTIVPDQNNILAWDHYCYTNNNPIMNTDSSGHSPDSWGFSFTIDTYGLKNTLNQFGMKIGVDNLSGITASALSFIGLTADVVAAALDTTACVTSTAGIVIGATSGAVITMPGGGTAIVGGILGGGVGWATAELGNQLFLQPANGLAIFALFSSVGSELITGATGIHNTISLNSDGIFIEGQAVYGPSFQTGSYLTTLGLVMPISYLSAGLQYAAVAADLGKISPDPLYVEGKLQMDFKKHNFNVGYNVSAKIE